MAAGWSYSGDPRRSPLDEIRMLIGDTDSTQPWTLLDAEIQYYISVYGITPWVLGKNFRAAAEACDSIVAKLKGTVSDKKVGDLSVTFNDSMLKQFVARAYQLRQKANILGVGIYAGGISRADKEANDADPDRIQPGLTIDGMNKVGTQNDPWSGQ